MEQRRFDVGKVLRRSAVAPLGILLGVLAFQGITWAGLRTTTASYRVDGAALARAERPGPGLRVLFIGNSFTFYNDMPGMRAYLVATGPSAAHPLLAVSYAPGGQELAQDVHNKEVERLLHAVHWNVVVLQERSWRLSQDERAWRAGTEPYAKRLNAESHPSPLGSYLAASVLYDELYGVDPADSSYDGGFDPSEARWLRSIAGQTVQLHPLPDVRSDWQSR